MARRVPTIIGGEDCVEITSHEKRAVVGWDEGGENGLVEK
jgi:hypothetical protein